jgi:serine/threonine-protein kinase RsbW
MDKTGEFTIPGRFECVSELCAFVASGAEQAGFNLDEIFHIELACDEACTNIIEHAYGGEGVGEIRATWLINDGTFMITIIDNGPKFDPDKYSPPKVPANPDDLDNLQIGGLGIHFMRNLMDEVYFSYDEGHGNKLVMVKRLSKNSNQ